MPVPELGAYSNRHGLCYQHLGSPTFPIMGFQPYPESDQQVQVICLENKKKLSLA